jgi:aryl-alcohol dehydrogenase-like predicted oxidoreductase
MGTEALSPSRIGLGCMGFSQGYGEADDLESIRAIRGAVDAGTVLLDTAQSYGQGHNERLLSIAIGSLRDRVVLATKFGIVRGPDGVALDAHPDRIRGYCEASLLRLGVEYIDLYYLHRVDPQVPLEDSVGAMAELVTAGLVTRLGVSEVTPEQLRRAHAVAPISAVQTEWSLFWREVEDELVPAARELGINVVAYSPLGRGLLTGTVRGDQSAAGNFRSSDPRFSGSAIEANISVVDTLSELARVNDCTTGQLCLAWLLAQGPDVYAIPGSRRAERLLENAAASTIDLTPETLRQIEAFAGRDRWAGDRQSFAAVNTSRSEPPG